MSRRRRASRKKIPLDAAGSRPASGAAPSTRHAMPTSIVVAGIVAAGLWAYATSFAGVFVLDDVRAIARNPSIRVLWPLSTPFSPPTASTVAGRPIANLSLAINYALAPLDARDVFDLEGSGSAPDTFDRLRRNARGYHVGNLLIHLLAALVLFGVVRRTLSTNRLKPLFEASATWIAGTAALVWAVHPLTTAAVTYIVQRVESLMSLFYLLTVYCSIRASERVHSRAWTAAAITSCALGMASKEAMVSAPLIVAAWLRLFGSKQRRDEHLPLLIGLVSTWVILAALLYGERRAPSIGLEAVTVWRYLLTQAEVIVHYLRLAFVPTALVFLYDWPLAESLLAVLPQATLLAALTAATAIGIGRRWPLSFPGAWFFLILAPSSSVLPIVTEVAAEHRMYLPLAAVIAMLVAAAYLGARRIQIDRHTGRAAAAVAAVATVALLAIETRARNQDYWSEERLWQDTVTKRPGYARPRVLYGSALSRAGRLAEAEAQLQTAVELAPGDSAARMRLASVLVQQGKPDAAIPHLQRLAARQPDDPAACRLLGEIHAARGEDALAVQYLGRAISGMGDDPQLLVRLALILADSRDVSVRDGARALALAERAVTVTSRRDPWALTALALAQGEVGRVAEAADTAREALQLARSLNASPTLIRQLERMAGW